MGETKVTLAGPKTAKKLRNEKYFRSIVIARNLPEGFVITDIAQAQKILNLYGKLTSLELTSEKGNDGHVLKDLDLYLKTNSSPNDIEKLTESFHLNLTAFGFLSYVVGLFIVYSSVNLAYEQRKGLLKSLRSIGVSARLLSSILITETVLFAIISASFGFICSILLASTLLPNVSITLRDLFGINITQSIPISYNFFILSLAISIVGAICSSASSLWKMATLDPLDTSKQLAWYEKTRVGLKLQSLISAFLILLIPIMLVVSNGLISSFILLAAVLILATLLLPIFLWFS